MSVRIIVDSSTNLPQHILDRVQVVPMNIQFGEETFVDGITISHEEFYKKLEASDQLPRTSQATPVAFEPFFEQIQKDGDSAVVITLASSLSGTYQSATIAAMDYDNIFVVDGNSVTIGGGLITIKALALADAGMNAQDIAQTLTQFTKQIRIVAMVDTLEYLQKGGRLSKAAAIAGGLLNIKPIITMYNGEITVIGKARGAKQAALMLAEKFKEFNPDQSQQVLLGYSGTDDSRLQQFLETAELWNDQNKPEHSIIGSVIGTHVGPGAVAIGFFETQK